VEGGEELMPKWGKGKHSEDDDQRGLPKFVRDEINKENRKAGRKAKGDATKKKRGEK